MAIPDDVIEQIKSIHNLIERGATEGEKEAAANALRRVMDRYGVTEEQLAEFYELRKKYPFTVKNKIDSTILFQCYRKVCNIVGDIQVWKAKGGRKFYLELTESEFTELEKMYQHYSKLWVAELDLLLTAFCGRHNLFAADAECADTSGYTYVDWERIKRARELMKALKGKSYEPEFKQLTPKN